MKIIIRRNDYQLLLFFLMCLFIVVGASACIILYLQPIKACGINHLKRVCVLRIVLSVSTVYVCVGCCASLMCFSRWVFSFYYFFCKNRYLEVHTLLYLLKSTWSLLVMNCVIYKIKLPCPISAVHFR